MVRDARHSTTKSATTFALASATLMIAHQVAGKATRDAIFLSHYDVTALPKIVIIAAVLSMIGVVLMSRLLVVYGPSRVIPAAFGISTIFFFGNWWLYEQAPARVAVLLYLQMAIFGAVLISGFWSVVNERFDPHTAKHTIARVAAAATLGGVLGGLLAGKVAAVSDVRSMLLVLGGLHFACFFTVRAVGDPRVGSRVDTKSTMQSGVKLLATNRYLQLMGLLMVLAAVMAALVDYAFKSAASQMLNRSEDLVMFFGQFYAAVGVLTFLIQSALGPRLLKRYGIGATLAVMPAVLFGTAFLSIAVAGKLWSVVVVRAGQLAFTNSFFRSAFELLYTPLPPLTKRPTKTIIDVASDRLGDVLGSGVLLLLLALSPNLSSTAVISIAIAVALFALYIVHLLYRGYVEQLATSLRDGAISLSDDEVIDATTRHTLAEASGASERAILMAKIRAMKQERGAGDPPFAAGDIVLETVAVAGPDPEMLREISAATEALMSGSTAQIQRCLAGATLDVRLVPYLIPLLANDDVAEDIRMELRWKAPQTIGTLTDALLDPDMPLLARQRIPSILEVTHNPRAVDALLAGLGDEEFNVRYSSGRALARMNERDTLMHVEASQVFAAVEREVSVDRSVWVSRNIELEIQVPLDMASTPLTGDPRIDYAMEHVFTLLSLTLDRDALMLSRQAVQSSDRNFVAPRSSI
jgi:AAA family ATP:ADP antiporter